MNMYRIITFFTSLINIGTWGQKIVNHLYYAVVVAAMFLDSLAYSILRFCYMVFQTLCCINMDSIVSLVEGFTNRIEALVIVLVVYKIATMFIGFLSNPDDFQKKSPKFLKNLFIAAALLVSYKFIFTVFNEFNMYLIGNQVGYKYTVLNELFDIPDSENGKPEPGLIVKLVFADEVNEAEKEGGQFDTGSFIAASIAELFYYDISEVGTNTQKYLYKVLYCDGDITLPSSPGVSEPECRTGQSDKANFSNLTKYADFLVQRESDYPPQKYANYLAIFGGLIALYIAYSFIGAGIAVSIRMFKLLILQVLAPVAIINGIADDNGFSLKKGSSKFATFVEEYFKIFTQAAVRMLSILLITAFLSAFVKRFDSIFKDFTQIGSGQGMGVRLIVFVIVIISGYVFAGRIPEFVNKVLDAHLGGAGRNPFGSLISGMIGGARGGAKTGGFGGALAGLGTGLGAGLKQLKENEGKGGKIVEAFKNSRQKGETLGANVAAHGGLGGYLRDSANERFGVNSRHQRKLDQLQREKDAVNAVESSTKHAMKDEKLTEEERNALGLGIGAENLKYGENKDEFVQNGLANSTELQNAMADYDTISKDESLVRKAESDYEEAKNNIGNVTESENQKVEAAKKDLETKQATLDAARKVIKSAATKHTENANRLSAAEAEYKAAQKHLDTVKNGKFITPEHKAAALAAAQERIAAAGKEVSAAKNAIADFTSEEKEAANIIKTYSGPGGVIEQAQDNVTKTSEDRDAAIKAAKETADSAEKAIDTAKELQKENAQKAKQHVLEVKSKVENALKDQYDRKQDEKSANDADIQRKTQQFIRTAKISDAEIEEEIASKGKDSRFKKFTDESGKTVYVLNTKEANKQIYNETEATKDAMTKPVTKK